MKLEKRYFGEEPRIDVECAPVHLAELSEKLLGNRETVIFSIRRSTGEVLVADYVENHDGRKKLSNQPLWYQYMMDDDIIQLPDYHFFRAENSVESFARTFMPADWDEDNDDWDDDSLYGLLTNAIYREGKAGYARVLKVMDDNRLWKDYEKFGIKAAYEFSKTAMERYGFQYVDDRPSLKDWMKSVPKSEYYIPLERILKDQLPDYDIVDYDWIEDMQRMFSPRRRGRWW